MILFVGELKCFANVTALVRKTFENGLNALLS